MAEGTTLNSKPKSMKDVFWDETNIGSALKSLMGAVTLPRDVYEGKVDPVSDEGIGRAFDMAGVAGTGARAAIAAKPSLVPEGDVLGVFAGRKARTADLNMADAAEDLDYLLRMNPKAKSDKMEFARQFRENWNITGWHQGKDGRYRFEIPDGSSGINPTFIKTPGVSTQLGNVLDHRRLFEAYPGMADTKIYSVDPSRLPQGARAYYSPLHDPVNGHNPHIVMASGLPYDEAMSTVLHEIQHGVQHREGLAYGGGVNDPDYWNLAGESEARNVEGRRLFREKDKDSIPHPLVTMDVPWSQQILKPSPDWPQAVFSRGTTLNSRRR